MFVSNSDSQTGPLTRMLRLRRTFLIIALSCVLFYFLARIIPRDEESYVLLYGTDETVEKYDIATESDDQTSISDSESIGEIPGGADDENYDHREEDDDVEDVNDDGRRDVHNDIADDVIEDTSQPSKGNDVTKGIPNVEDRRTKSDETNNDELNTRSDEKKNGLDLSTEKNNDVISKSNTNDEDLSESKTEKSNDLITKSNTNNEDLSESKTTEKTIEPNDIYTDSKNLTERRKALIHKKESDETESGTSEKVVSAFYSEWYRGNLTDEERKLDKLHASYEKKLMTQVN